MSPLEEAARIIARSRFLVALTGAGISADSGIPTFRGRDGLWSRYRPEDLATPEAFARNPRLVWEWYRWRMEIVFRARPNPGHLALAELERMGLLKCVITQNVDGLHQLAGSRCVVELHGSIRRVRCVSCSYRAELSEPPREIPPRCPRCGSLLRPDVVWFGEPIPRDALEKAFDLCERADAILVIGTSGKVMPAAMLPQIVRSRGGAVVEINIEESDITPIATVFVRGRASEVLPKLVELVRELVGQ
ncbi:MAG: NAD-dependent deacylase [Crenarchaeota archaeon]|nr:NAD-dependent deacylase [Thermoproteota archaeon]